MSTRWYPLYQPGNPQLRVFLPNFWMKLVKPKKEPPPNIVHFECSMEMTNYDVKNYLEKIYKIPVVDVHTFIKMGRFKKNFAGYIVKDEDARVAVVSLPSTEKFKFPNLFPETEKTEADKAKEQIDTSKAEFRKGNKKLDTRPGVPAWFNL